MTQRRPDRIAVRYGARSFGRMRASTWGRSSVETAADPSPGKCLAHAARPRPRAKATARRDVRNCREPSGPSAVSKTGAKSASMPEARSPCAVARPAAKASGTPVNDRAGEKGGDPGSAFTAPPSWSANVTPAAPPKTPGRSVVTTRSAAFCCGVRASASARAASTSGRLRRPRQHDGERGALTGCRCHRERPVQSVDDLAADVETEPRPADASAHLRIEAIELLENPLLLRGGDPDALVDDVDEMLRLLLDELEQLVLLGSGEVVAVGEQRLRATVHGGERRPQLVRGRGDEIGARPLEHVPARRVAHRQDASAVERRDRRGEPPILVI